jgi:hypothetical protein
MSDRSGKHLLPSSNKQEVEKKKEKEGGKTEGKEKGRNL